MLKYVFLFSCSAALRGHIFWLHGSSIVTASCALLRSRFSVYFWLPVLPAHPIWMSVIPIDRSICVFVLIQASNCCHRSIEHYSPVGFCCFISLLFRFPRLQGLLLSVKLYVVYIYIYMCESQRHKRTNLSVSQQQLSLIANWVTMGHSIYFLSLEILSDLSFWISPHLPTFCMWVNASVCFHVQNK